MKYNFISSCICLLFFIFIKSSCQRETYNKEDLPGIVIVPGDGGAHVEARLNKTNAPFSHCERHSDWYTIWLDYFQMSPFGIGCWTENMAMIYDNTTHTTRNADGVDTRIPGFGNTTTIEFLNDSRSYIYFAYIVETLVAMGYKRNETLTGAPFDFRKAPNELSEYFTSLKGLIEEVQGSTRGPVILLAHSLGAPTLNYFLNQQTQQWRDANIRCLITLAGAWGGAVKSVKMYAAGDDLGSSLLNRLDLREQQRTTSSLAFLLPDPELWEGEVLVTTPDRNYTVRDLPDLLLDMNLTDAYEMYKDTKDLLIKFSTPPHVPLHCLYAVGMDTVELLTYAPGGYFPGYPVLKTGPGDGTVNQRSSELCIKYASLQSQPVSATKFTNVDHMTIVTSRDTLMYIANVVMQETQNRIRNRTQIHQVFLSSIPGADGNYNTTSQTILEITDGLMNASDLDIDAVIASVDEGVRQRRLGAVNENSLIEKMKQRKLINLEIQKKMEQAQRFHFTIERLRRRDEQLAQL